MIAVKTEYLNVAYESIIKSYEQSRIDSNDVRLLGLSQRQLETYLRGYFSTLIKRFGPLVSAITVYDPSHRKRTTLDISCGNLKICDNDKGVFEGPIIFNLYKLFEVAIYTWISLLDNYGKNERRNKKTLEKIHRRLRENHL